MTERYIVTTPSGEAAIRTNSTTDAERYRTITGGTIVDRTREEKRA